MRRSVAASLVGTGVAGAGVGVGDGVGVRSGVGEGGAAVAVGAGGLGVAETPHAASAVATDPAANPRSSTRREILAGGDMSATIAEANLGPRAWRTPILRAAALP